MSVISFLVILPLMIILTLIYFGSKGLTVILSVIFAICYLIRNAKSKPTKKLTTVMTTLLIILQLIAIPGDALIGYTNAKVVIHQSKISLGLCAVAEKTTSQTLKYKNQKYKDLSQDLKESLGDRYMTCDLDDSTKFEKSQTLLYTDDSNFSTMLFGNGSKSVIYIKKDAPDQMIIYLDSLNISEKIWCLEEKFEAAKQTYCDLSNYDFYIVYEKDDTEKRKKVDKEFCDAVEACIEKRLEHDVDYFPEENVDSEWVKLDAHSKDNRVVLKNIFNNLRIMDGKIYYRYNYNGYDRLRYLDVQLQ